MYNYIDDNFLGSENFSTFTLPSKNFNPFLRSKFEINNFNQLPAIKEEDGRSSEGDSEISTKNISYTKSSTKLPPLNINCLMNINVKQSHSIWNTSFGKRLINETHVYDFVNGPDIEKTCFNKKGSKKVHPPKTFSKMKFVQEHNGKTGKGDKIEISPFGRPKKKFKKFKTENQNHTKKAICQEKKPLEAIIKTKSAEESPEVSEVLLKESLTFSLDSKPQQFLTECVRSIIENHSSQFKCDHCNNSFTNFEELYDHQKQHEIEKETCLLCKKIFYSSNEFVQHLLTHEGVDRFSCKKCKKYFPSLRKYKEHYQDFHYKPPATFSFISPPKLEFVRKWLPKFECKRCKIEFESVQNYEAHRRVHAKKDLARAYLLNLKNI